MSMNPSIQKKYLFIMIIFLFILGWFPSFSYSGMVEPKNRIMSFWLDTFSRHHPLGSLRERNGLTRTLLAKAEPDECFYGMGISHPPDTLPCEEGGIPKVNQTYLWGLTKSQDNLWFGTGANVQCFGRSDFFSRVTPYQGSCIVCEFGESKMSPPLPEGIGDWRPPRIFVYDLSKNNLIDKTPSDPLMEMTLGFRSAGSLKEIVFLGGPNLTEGINLFAFNASTGEYLGSQNFLEYQNIRKWLAVNGALYTAVGNSNKSNGAGSVLRWSGDLKDPFQFKVVGILDGAGAELTFHENSIFVSPWPVRTEQGDSVKGLSGLWMSPQIPAGGLNVNHSGLWEKVWQADDYEPDPIIAKTYGCGALASFDGFLYWGSMHVPFMSLLIHATIYGILNDPQKVISALFGTHRATSLFRGRNFGTSKKKIQLLYGMPFLPKYTGTDWEIVSNNMKKSYPLWGLSGFGNFFNFYTWTMSVYNNKLYVGTLDWSIRYKESLNTLLEEVNIDPIPEGMLEFPTWYYGGDLFRFFSSKFPAFPESISGVGNYTNYGIRTMVSDEALYIGTANPLNLLTAPDDDLPEGGWELIKLN